MEKTFFTRRTKRDEIGPGGIWGLVGYEDYRNVRLFAPVPLNFLWAFGRWLWPWVAWRWSLWLDAHMPPNDPPPPAWASKLWDEVHRNPHYGFIKDPMFTVEDLERIAREPGQIVIVDERRCDHCRQLLDENNVPLPTESPP